MDVVVENLTKSFGYQKAVDSVSFEVKKGEILGFLGPNGAGKTTTLKIMSCFLFPDYGNIRIGKYSIHNQTNHRLSTRAQSTLRRNECDRFSGFHRPGTQYSQI